jgi:hypothetical protein
MITRWLLRDQLLEGPQQEKIPAIRTNMAVDMIMLLPRTHHVQNCRVFATDCRKLWDTFHPNHRCFFSDFNATHWRAAAAVYSDACRVMAVCFAVKRPLSVALQQHHIGLLTLIGLFGGNSTGRREKISEKLAPFSLVLVSGVAQVKEDVTT